MIGFFTTRASSKRGFTLIELLVVISIVSLLSSVILASVNTARARARDAVRYSDIQQIRTAIELYINEYGHAPYLEKDCSIDNPLSSGCEAQSENIKGTAGTNWSVLQGELAKYISKLPMDPCGIKCGVFNNNQETYRYRYEAPSRLIELCSRQNTFCPSANNTDYLLYAEKLETSSSRFGILSR